MKRILTLLVGIVFFFAFAKAQQIEEPIMPIPIKSIQLNDQAVSDMTRTFKKVDNLQFDLKNFYNYFQRSDRSGKFRLMLPSAPITVSWVENDLMADDYELLAAGDNGARTSVSSDLRTYEGYIVDAPEYSVAITISKDFINMMIEQPDGTYYLEQSERFTNAGRGSFVYYRALDFIDSKAGTHTCGTESRDENAVRDQINNTVGGERVAGVCYRVEISIVSDQLMYARYGTVPKVEAHNVAVWNNVGVNYKKQFANDFEFKILKQVVATSASALTISNGTNATIILGDLVTWAIKNNGFGSKQFDIAQMWTTRDIAGDGNSGVVGVAYVGTVCGENRAQLIEDFSNNSENLRIVVAHESGHNFDCKHDAPGSPYIMAPSVNITNAFSTQSKTQLNAFVNKTLTGSNNCFSSCANPGQKPEVDFTSSSFAICSGSKISFSDNSTNDPTSWLWSFPGGVPAQSNAETPQVVYATPGTYDVTLKVTNAYGSTTVVKKQLIFVGAVTGTHCKPTATPNTKAGIRLFKIGNMSNSSGNNKDDGNMYKDFSCSRIASVVPNTTYDCELNVGDCEANIFEGVQMYADFNNDNDFEDLGEFLGYSSFLYCGSFSFKLTTPASPVENKVLRLRVISSTSKTITLESCVPPADGQIEDYGLIFQCPTPCGPSGLLPTANFNSTITTICTGNTVKFRDRSTSHPTKWEWSFPGGTPATSTEENPSVIYSAVGTYDVSLKVTNTTGENTIQKKKIISVEKVNNAHCAAPSKLVTKAGIKSFKLANISNKSGNAETDGNRYMDFACIHVATLEPTTSYDIELEIGDCAANVKEVYRIYIDYNNDGDFSDPGEFVAGNNSVPSCGVQTYAPGTNASLRFTTPTSPVAFKVLRMRVITQTGQIGAADSMNPCFNPTDGQVEDYGVIFRTTFAMNTEVKNSTCHQYNNASIKLNPAGGKVPYNYDWNLDAYDGKSEATNLKPGNYSVTVTDGEGLFISRKFTVTEPDSIIVGDTRRHAQCSEPTGSIELLTIGGGAGAPFTFAWNHSTTETGRLVENLYGGLYIVTISDKAGCKKEWKMQLDSTIMPDLSSIEDSIKCAGQSVILTAKKGTKYIWSTGATTPSIKVTKDGNYAVTATNGECENSTSADIAFITFTPKLIGDTKVCQGAEAIIKAQNAVTYLWSTGETDALIRVYPQKTTTYVVTATYSNCDQVVPWTITVTPSGVSINATKDASCKGEKITLSSSDGKPYTWNTGETASSINVIPTKDTTYSFNIPAPGCLFTVTKDIKIGTGVTSPTVLALGATTFCQGNETTLVAPSDMSTYKWSSGETTQTIKASKAGNYVVTVTQNGCEGVSKATTITVNPLPAATISSSAGATICNGANLTLSAPANLDSYFWSNNEVGKSTTVTQAGTYTVTVSDAKGCIGVSQPFAVALSSSPTANAGADVAICNGSTTSLAVISAGGTSPYTYAWSPATSLSAANVANPTAGPIQTTTYTVTVIDNKGCTNADAVVVTVNPAPAVPTVTTNKNLLTSSATSGNQWFFNGQAIAGATAQTYAITKDGKYSVKVSNTSNCSATSVELTLKFIGTDEVLSEQSFRIFPNPMSDFLMIQIKAASAKKLEVTDVLGRVILSQDLQSAESFEQRLNTTTWNSGTYFINIKNNDQEIIGVRKVVKL
jgi:PKD repeat protein